MSFILDALKKLEREKETPEPGVVMVGPVPWGERDRRRGPGLAITGAVLVVALAGSFWWLRSGADPPAAPSASGEDTSVVAPEPAGQAASETTEPTPAIPSSRSTRPATAGPTPPPPRDLPRPRDTTPQMAREAPLADLDEAAPTEMTRAVSEEPALITSDNAATDEAGPAPEYRLTAISSRDGHPIALLNDRLVREGDRFGDVLILRIGESDVEIEVNGKRRTIGF